ncbi:MAG: hypothetical protein JW995_10040 [Melioribacteraceae bacterium]|nr:hypothetical protein [Melioribacteraceae bacterium]
MLFSEDLYNDYDTYKETRVVNKRFNYDEMNNYIDEAIQSDLFRQKVIGSSLEKRNIRMISYGSGKTHVLAWSQMHGDEPTATMALIDIFNFLSEDDKYNDIRKRFQEKLTIHFIPMLNPDGAERFTRRNALDIDLNRDALRLQYPESQALRNIQDSIKPRYGFNLHDQDQRYTAGNTYKAATLSFLAPAYNYQKDINEIRSDAMKIIVKMKDELDKYIPGHIARYDDEFEPRAFGDNFVKWGTGTILIESGGWKNNYEKQFLRKLNFISILIALNSMATGDFKKIETTEYFKIPENKKRLFDLLLKNLKQKYNSDYFTLDIGINFNEKGKNGNRDDYYEGIIEDLGDLSTFYGYDEYDCTGMTVENGRIYPCTFENISELKKLDFDSLLSEGYTTVELNSIDPEINHIDFPITIMKKNTGKIQNKVKLDIPANLVILENNKVRYTIVNGFVFDNRSKRNNILNGIILK